MSEIKFQTKKSPDAINLFGGNKEAFQSKDDIVIVVGPAGTGKTFAMCLKMHLYCVKYPGVKVLLCRKSLPSLRNSVVKTYQKILHDTGYTNKVRVLGETRPTNFIYEESEQEWDGVKYKGVSEITLSQIDAQGKALGAEYDMVYVNQPDTEGLTEEEFLTVCSRARLSNAPYQQRLADPNPASDQHWLLKGSLPDIKTGEPKWNLIRSWHKDNPEWYDQEAQDWTKLGKNNIRQLERLPENRRKSLLEGEWYSNEGMAFESSWDYNKHVLRLETEFAENLGVSKLDDEGNYVKDVHNLQGWHHYLSIDWGGTDPFVALLIGRHPDLDLFVIHSHIYVTEEDIFRVSQLTKEMCEGYDIKTVIADRGRAEQSVMEKALGRFLTIAKKGSGSAIDSINVCVSELNSDRWKFLDTEHSLFNVKDELLVQKNKLMGYEEIPNLKKDPKTGAIAAHQQDHYYDAWKYFCRYWVELTNSYNYPTLVWI